MFIKRIDLLSPSITLYTNGNLRHSSIFSGIFTIAAYTFLIGMGCYYAIDLIQRNNPSALYLNRYDKDSVSFLLNSNYMFNFIQVLDNKKDLKVAVDFDSFRIFGIREYIEKYTTSNRDISQYEHWLYGNCNNESDTKGIDNLITMDDHFNESACISKYFNKKEKKYYNTNEQGFIWPSVDNDFSNPNKTFYGIIVEQCRNDSLKNDCKPIEEIKKYESSHSILIRIIDYYTNIYNYDEPLTKYFLGIPNGIYPDSYTINNLNFNPVIIETHNGYFFDNLIEEFSYFFDKDEKEVANWKIDNEGIYACFYFWVQNGIQYYKRTYKRLQDILAEIGGLSNCILFIATILNKLVSQYITILDLENLLIGVNHKSSNNIFFSIRKNYFEGNIKNKVHYDKKEEEDEKNSIKNIINTGKKFNSASENITIKNDRYNKSILTKNIMSNNYLTNINNINDYIKVLNKEKEVNKLGLKSNKKIEYYQPIQKNFFGFLDYLLFIFCNKRNNILIYEEFRRKVLSEEHIIKNYFIICELLNKNQHKATKIKKKYSMSKIIDLADKKFTNE